MTEGNMVEMPKTTLPEIVREEIPFLTNFCGRLTGVVADNPIAEKRGWQIENRKPLKPGKSPIEEARFKAMGDEVAKGPNGETIQLTLRYPDGLSNKPNDLMIFGDDHEGIFNFRYQKDEKQETLLITFKDGSWRVDMEYSLSQNKMVKVSLGYLTSSEIDDLIITFENVQFDPHDPTRIKFNKERANVECSFPTAGSYLGHSPPSVSGSIEDFIKPDGIVRQHLESLDRTRAMRMKEDPGIEDRFKERGIPVPVVDHTGLIVQRLQEMPPKIELLTALRNIRERIDTVTATFERELKK